MPLLTTSATASARNLGLLSNSKEIPTVIGQAFGGGYYVGQVAVGGGSVATHYLVVAPKAVGMSGLIQWGTASTSFTNSVIDGPSNSASLNSVSYPAAYFCEGLTIGGYTDWYLPARHELEIAFFNLKPTTQTNRTQPGSGVNPYAVPARASVYTADFPVQTTVAIFQNGGAEFFKWTDNFQDPTHWTSSSRFTSAYCQRFSQGEQHEVPKTYNYEHYARAFRRVPI